MTAQHVFFPRRLSLSISSRLCVRVCVSGHDSILEPLCFPEVPLGVCGAEARHHPPPEPSLLCLFCSESTPLSQKDALLKHLLLQHKLLIADVKLIAELPQYELPNTKTTSLLLHTLSLTVAVFQVPVVLEGQIPGAASHWLLQCV